MTEEEKTQKIGENSRKTGNSLVNGIHLRQRTFGTDREVFGNKIFFKDEFDDKTDGDKKEHP